MADRQGANDRRNSTTGARRDQRTIMGATKSAQNLAASPTEAAGGRAQRAATGTESPAGRLTTMPVVRSAAHANACRRLLQGLERAIKLDPK
jgi:hypothetical protein